MTSAPDYEIRRKRESQRKRLKGLQMAGYCFAENGFKKTTMEDVARRAGVSKGLVFHYFGSKQAIFKAVIDDGLMQWATLSEYRASAIENDALAELRELFLASFDFVEQHPVLLLFARDDQELGEDYRKKVARRNRLWRERVQKTLKQGIRQGVILDIDVKRVAAIFHRMQTALVTAESRSGSIPRYDRSTVELAIEVFLRGIARTSSD